MEKRLAVYAGTFDPLTAGHLWMIGRGALLFDKLIVAIGINPEKRCMFSVEERLLMLRESTKHFINIDVSTFMNQFLVTFAQSAGARFILRGVRTVSDFEYEHAMRNINGDLNPDITTIFLTPPRSVIDISSSMVKGLIGPQGWEGVVKSYVPQPVFEKLVEAHYAKSK